jgi:hypothetical protein
MPVTKRTFVAIAALCAALLPLNSRALSARDADAGSYTVVAAQTAKQQCVRACRARYRDCRHLNQMPSFDCKSIYQDCTQYSCTGLGPG